MAEPGFRSHVVGPLPDLVVPVEAQRAAALDELFKLGRGKA
jgi:hypothetical protein